MVRAFIAIQFPNSVKIRVAQAIKPLREQVGADWVRWVDPDLYHLTVKFLGEVTQHDIEQIKRVVENLARDGSSFETHVGEFGVFPNTRRPRVLWVGLQEPTGAMRSLQRKIEDHLEPLGFEKERRKFHPHITVARVRRGASRNDLRRLSAALERFSLAQLAAVHTDQIHLVQSELTPEGPIYSRLASFSISATA